MNQINQQTVLTDRVMKHEQFCLLFQLIKPFDGFTLLVDDPTLALSVTLMPLYANVQCKDVHFAIMYYFYGNLDT